MNTDEAIKRLEEEGLTFQQQRDNYADIAKQREIDCFEMRVEIERLREREKQAAELLRFPKDGITLREGWYERRDAWLKDAGL